VLFDRIPAPLLYVQANQIGAVAPFGLAGRRTVRVEVEYEGRTSSGLDVPVADSAPGVFTSTADGRGQAAVLNQNGRVNSPSNPAAPETVATLYSTGAGATSPESQDGAVTAAPYPVPLLPVIVGVGHIGAEILYAGAAPGMVAGVLQVNFRIPKDTPTGDAVPLIIKVGDNFSQQGVTIAVR
jgi:uncharacterized protein (TIGR03437 family)